MNSNIRVGLVIGSVLTVLMGLIGFAATSAMRTMESVSGNSLAEAFYNAFGLWATAIIILAVILTLVSIFKLYLQNEQIELARQQHLSLTALCESQRPAEDV